VTTSAIDGRNNLVGFQGDLTFDERAVRFQDEPIQKAGLTSDNWIVAGRGSDPHSASGGVLDRLQAVVR